MSTASAPPSVDIETQAINTIRVLSAEAVQQANSGHPGMPMGCAPMAYALWRHHLRFNPRNPDWVDRDRFVLSAGHGSMLLYSLLHLTGFDLSMDDLRDFRQWDSATPGHPEYGHTAGVETTTGPLGQGLGNAVGMALAEVRLAAEFNRDGHAVVDHHTYVIAGDGDLMEGVQAEAVSLAGHLALGKLVVLYDDNKITIDGQTDLAFSEDVRARFAACGWDTALVEDGTDVGALDEAINAAKSVADKPSLIAIRTHIGHGSPNRANTSKAHGEPLGDEELALTKERLGWSAEPFDVPEAVLEHFREATGKGAAVESDWDSRWAAYSAAFPDLAAEFARRMAGDFPDGWRDDLPTFVAEDGPMATRAASGKVLNAVADRCPELIGGSADLAGSNKTRVETSGDFGPSSRDQRNLHFGIREHAMGAIMNGMALHRGLRPYGGTFLIFSDYMRPSIRLAALMELPAIYVFTHDSVAVGEDGPTHQPIEQIASLRAIPGMTVLRPADANETSAAWAVAMAQKGPVALALTRQKIPVLDANAAGVARGAYVFRDPAGDGELDAILIATGSEVHIAADAAGTLESEVLRVRVVSMPSWELFEQQSAEYRESVLPTSVGTRVSVEAGSTFGWSRYVGLNGASIGIDRFGASAPGGENLQRFGFSADNVATTVRGVCQSD